jgi:hypothetical protein
VRAGSTQWNQGADSASALCRINILGSTGTGTTLLGLALAESLGAAVVDTDSFYWWPFRPPCRVRRNPHARRDRLLAELARHPRAIVCGSVADWGCPLEFSFDWVIALVPARKVSGQRPKGPALLRLRIGCREQRRQDHWLLGCTSPVLRLGAELSISDRVAQALGFLNQGCRRQPPDLLRSQPIASLHL